jgi:archaellum component FlaC
MMEEAERPAVFDIEQEYKKSLEELAERLAQAQQDMQASQENMQPSASAESLQQAMAHQQNALDQLGQNEQQFQEQIQQANEDLAKVYKLMADVERFKQVYGAQQMLEREARTYKDETDPGLDEQIRLKELSENENEIRETLEQLKEDMREHAHEIEQEYPQVAQDARDIANAIESLEIPGTMESASRNLSVPDAPKGHADAHEALEALESLISFCEATQGQGSSQCELRLQIQMALNPGNTLGQLGKSLSSGAGLGQGMGQGQGAGTGMSSTAFNMYGNDPFGNPTAQESAYSTRRMHDAQAEPVPSDELAGSFEELATSKDDVLDLDGGGGEHVIEEYRPLIEAYFRGLAEEER